MPAASQIHHANFTELLAGKPAGSVDRYVLLDAQDWMTDRQLNELWSEITRTAAPDARVIFRTAAEAELLPGRARTIRAGPMGLRAKRSRIDFTAPRPLGDLWRLPFYVKIGLMSAIGAGRRPRVG